MKSDPIQSALAKLDEIPLRTPAGKAALVKALSSKYNLVVAKAARIIGTAQWLELSAELATVCGHLMDRGGAGDKGCTALAALCRSLVGMDYDNPDLFLRGLRYRQMEPGWGGASDAAVDVRSICAMGLVNTGYPYKLRELVPLLVDSEWIPRAGAVRAIAAVGSEAASLLLRLKTLSGDAEPEVMSECFTAMLALEGADGVALVTRFASGTQPEIRESAILALGASRRADAVEWLCVAAGREWDPDLRKCQMLALSTSRTEQAIDFLLNVVQQGSREAAANAMDALDLHRHDGVLQERVRAAMARTGSDKQR